MLATRSVLAKSDELELEEEAEESSLLLLGASVDKIIVSTIGLEEKNERSWMVPLNIPGPDGPEPGAAAGGALGAVPAAPTPPTAPVAPTVALGGATAVVAAATELLPATEPPKLPLLGGTDLTVWPLAA